ncbi:MAG: hypothetical protein ACJASQ_003501 [Crocinitomicaceae bacterium]|jgi:hypothetical protein
MKTMHLQKCAFALISILYFQVSLATECSTATPTTCGVSLTGSTGSDPSSGTAEGTCGTSDGTAGTIWYSIVGNGSNWSAETFATAGQYDTKIWVFSGTCGALSCVTGNDDGGSGLLSRVDFSTTNGVTYYIVVGGYSSSSGNYLLHLETDGTCGAGCSTAIPTTCGVSLLGSTIPDVSTGTGEGTCGTTDGTAGTVWYSVVGDGSTWTAEAVTTTGEYDTKIWVFTGTCGSLTCVTGDDDSGTGSLSLVSFATAASTTYYIVIGGSGTAEGAYQLDISNSGYCGSECLNAEKVNCGTTKNGNTTGQSVSGLGTCTTTSGTGGVEWYTFNGDGNPWTFEITSASFDTKIWVFSGSCEVLSCVAGDDDGGIGALSLVNFATTVGVTYFVIVGGYTSAEGTYALDVSSSPCAGPGGVRLGLQVWLKAGEQTKSDNPVTSWGNSGPNSNVTQLVSTIGTSLVSGANLNYNSGLSMSGATNGQGGVFSSATANRSELIPGNEISMFAVYADGDYDMSWSFHSQSSATNEYHAFGFRDSGIGSLYSSGTANELNYGSTDNRSVNILGMKGTASSGGTNSFNGIQNTSVDVGVFTANSGAFDLSVGLWPGSANDNITTENIIYDRDLTAVEFHRVESYLALKYGVTLGVEGVSQDYNLSDNSVVWTQSANNGFGYSVAGIVRDDNSALSQLKSRSSSGNSFGSYDDVVAIANGSNFNSPASFSANLSAFVWGSDGDSLYHSGNEISYATDNSETIQGILTRKWKVEESGTVGTVTVEVDLSGTLGSESGLADNDLLYLRLIVDEDGDFSSGATSIAPTSYNNTTDVAYFQHDFTPTSGTDSDPNNGLFFAIGSTNFSQAPLPIELSSLEVENEGCSNQINWATESEINNDYFSIERSYDMNDWESIGQVEGAGNSIGKKSYAFRDLDFPVNGVVYYSLIQVDFDGGSERSHAVAVNGFCGSNLEPIIYPNPIRENLFVETALDGELFIRDLSGKEIYLVKFNEGKTAIDVSRFSTGTYIIIIELSNGDRYQKKFVKL